MSRVWGTEDEPMPRTGEGRRVRQRKTGGKKREAERRRACNLQELKGEGGQQAWVMLKQTREGKEQKRKELWYKSLPTCCRTECSGASKAHDINQEKVLQTVFEADGKKQGMIRFWQKRMLHIKHYNQWNVYTQTIKDSHHGTRNNIMLDQLWLTY